ncbi:Leucine--tRNA ligase [Mycoplasmopsis edwardii]|uniref:Leucine--tRNA ligase n=1 Tax=Mycoplasmopsis edwardii TaxID=53558 RepID=A0A3B0QAW8_9BACT|nr:Leucine--tRNA ligase [Mycoplasmopsis edwardii]
MIKLVVQVNGKVRAVIEKEGDLSEDEIFALALAQPNVQKFIDGNEIKRKQYIKDKIIIFNV